MGLPPVCIIIIIMINFKKKKNLCQHINQQRNTLCSTRKNTDESACGEFFAKRQNSGLVSADSRIKVRYNPYHVVQLCFKRLHFDAFQTIHKKYDDDIPSSERDYTETKSHIQKFHGKH